MTRFPLARCLGIAAVALAGLTSAAPAIAASGAEVLQQYVGDWRGDGTMQGASNEKIRCRMSLTQGNQGRLIYNGRCTLAGTTMAINGTVAYLEDKNQYVAAMTSNAQFSGQVVGTRRGDNIIFSLKDRQKDQKGRPVDVTATLTFGSNRITTDFKMVYADNGEVVTASVPFQR